MKMNKIRFLLGPVLLLSFLILPSQALEGANHYLVRIQLTDYSKQMKQIQAHSLDLAGVNLNVNQVDLLVNDSENAWLKANGFKIVFTDSTQNKMALDPRYQNPVKVESTLKQLAAAYPTLARVQSIGKSIEGRDIWAIRLTKNVNQEDPSKPHVFFNSMHHAREIMTSEVGLDIVQTLLAGYGKNATLTHWLESYVIDVIPMFNVDGNNLVWTRDTMWRKNAHGGYGVDVNRNYPYAWNSCHGSSSSKQAQDYHGESAASEPETKVMMNFVKSIHPVFSISYHSYSEIVIYPYGCQGQHTPTRDVVEKIGKEMANLLVTDDGRGRYKAGTAPELLYSVDGGDIDWYYSEQVIPFVIEMNSSSLGFQPSYAQWRDKTIQAQRQGWGYLLSRMDGSSIYGQVKDQNGNAIENAVLLIKGLSNNFSQNYKVNPKGFFNVILNPGKYQVSVQVAGQKQLSTEVVVGNVRVPLELGIKK